MAKSEPYWRQAEILAAEINRKRLAAGAGTFTMLRTNGGTTKGSHTAYWLDFTRCTNGDLLGTTGVFADNPRDAVRFLHGYVSAVAHIIGDTERMPTLHQS